MSILGRRFRHTHDGVVVDLSSDEQEALATVLDQFRELLMMDSDPNLARLKPPARPDDLEANATYHEMVGDDLLRNRLEAVEIVELGLEGATLDEQEVTAWMQTLNGVRLFLGDRLGDRIEQLLDDERAEIDAEGDPDGAGLMLYEWLGWLLEQLVRAATKDLPDQPSGYA